jgi:hypothetical protein
VSARVRLAELRQSARGSSAATASSAGAHILKPHMAAEQGPGLARGRCRRRPPSSAG